MFAVESDRRDIINLLLDHEADITVRNPYGETTLMITARQGQTDIVQRLREARQSFRANQAVE